MSKIFKNTLKSFKSDITGEEREYSVNNALWIYMDSLFGMNQEKFDRELETNLNVAQGMFLTCVLRANGLEADYEDVMKNTSPTDVMEFYNDFFDTAFPPRTNTMEQAPAQVEAQK